MLPYCYTALCALAWRTEHKHTLCDVILTAWAFAKGSERHCRHVTDVTTNPACGLNQTHSRGASLIIFRLLGNHVCFYELLSAVSISECIGNGANSRIQKRVFVCKVSAELRFEAVFMASSFILPYLHFTEALCAQVLHPVMPLYIVAQFCQHTSHLKLNTEAMERH